jgi:hypothetical protein
MRLGGRVNNIVIRTEEMKNEENKKFGNEELGVEERRLFGGIRSDADSNDGPNRPSAWRIE